MISSISIITMVCEAVLALLIPVALLLIWKKKTGARIVPAFVGVAVFLIFALILEQILHLTVLQIDHGVSRAIKGNVWLYMLYAGLAAGIFEELGRFFGFSVFRKLFRDRRDAVVCGIGHGGFECIYLLCVGMVVNIVTALIINSMGVDVFTEIVLGGNSAAADTLFGSISGITPGPAAVAIAERLSALVLHISLSVWVYASVRYKKFRLLLPAAVLYHALVDFSPALYQFGMLKSIAVTEFIVAAVAVGAAVIAVFVYRAIGREECAEKEACAASVEAAEESPSIT